MTEWNPLLAMRAAMRNSEGLDRTERDALLVIIDRQPNCCPSAHQFATEAKVHRVTLLQAIARLELKGIIRVERIQGRGSTYHLIPGWQDRITGSVTQPVVSRDRLSSATTPVVSRNKTGSVTLPKESKDTKEKAIPSESFAFATAPADDSPPPSTSRTKRKASNGKSDKDPPDPRVSPVIATYHKTFMAEFGRMPSMPYKRAGRAIKELPSHVTVGTIQKAVVTQLTLRRHDTHARPSGCVELHEIVGALDKVLSWDPKKTNGYRQPEPEFSAGGYRPA